jgi:hypothetical protein
MMNVLILALLGIAYCVIIVEIIARMLERSRVREEILRLKFTIRQTQDVMLEMAAKVGKLEADNTKHLEEIGFILGKLKRIKQWAR